VETYRSFDELRDKLAINAAEKGLDAIIHCAAVSDYLAAGIYAPAMGTKFDPTTGQWMSSGADHASLIDRAAGKVKSDEPELWLRLVRAPKLIDLIRADWRFQGILVKFKLEVGVSEDRLLEIAEHSRQKSSADLMVANTLEGANSWAYLGPIDGHYQRLSRQELAARLIQAMEQLRQGATHG